MTHDLDTLYTICDRVAVLSDKHVLAADKLDVVEAIEDPGCRHIFTDLAGVQLNRQIRQADSRPRRPIDGTTRTPCIDRLVHNPGGRRGIALRVMAGQGLARPSSATTP